MTETHGTSGGGQHQTPQEHAAYVARLEAVVAAARALQYAGWWSGCVMVNQDKWDTLQAALATLDAG
jgi:hypothetical protein